MAVAQRSGAATGGHVERAPLCRERRDVAVTLANTEVVLSNLTMLVGAILHVSAIFAYLAIFGVDVTHLVISLSSMTLAFAFIFGNTLRTTYESVVFLFAARPYKVGDWIMYAGNFHRVTSFGLLWTQLHRYDGVRVSVRSLSGFAAGGTVSLRTGSSLLTHAPSYEASSALAGWCGCTPLRRGHSMRKQRGAGCRCRTRR